MNFTCGKEFKYTYYIDMTKEMMNEMVQINFIYIILLLLLILLSGWETRCKFSFFRFLNWNITHSNYQTCIRIWFLHSSDCFLCNACMKCLWGNERISRVQIMGCYAKVCVNATLEFVWWEIIYAFDVWILLFFHTISYTSGL